jgi:hypothetical protein
MANDCVRNTELGSFIGQIGPAAFGKLVNQIGQKVEQCCSVDNVGYLHESCKTRTTLWATADQTKAGRRQDIRMKGIQSEHFRYSNK